MTMLLKRSTTAGKVPLVADLADGQLAMNVADAILFMKKTVGGVSSVVQIGSEKASAADFRAGTANRALNVDQAWAAADFVTLTDGATVTMNLAAAINATVTIAGNRQLTFTNAKPGQSGAIEVIQGTGGSRLLTYGSMCDWGKIGAPILNTAVGKADFIFYFVRSTGSVKLSFWEDA